MRTEAGRRTAQAPRGVSSAWTGPLSRRWAVGALGLGVVLPQLVTQGSLKQKHRVRMGPRRQIPPGRSSSREALWKTLGVPQKRPRTPAPLLGVPLKNREQGPSGGLHTAPLTAP